MIPCRDHADTYHQPDFEGCDCMRRRRGWASEPVHAPSVLLGVFIGVGAFLVAMAWGLVP